MNFTINTLTSDVELYFQKNAQQDQKRSHGYN